MSGCWRVLVDFWSRPVRAEPLALFRILLGTTYLASLLFGLAPELDHLLDLCPSEALDGWLGVNGRFTVFRAPTQPELPSALVEGWNDWGARRATVHALFAVLVLAVAGMTVGCYVRACTIVAWFLTISLDNRLLWTVNGGDDLFRTALFYLMLAPAGAVWSVDRWLRLRVAEKGSGTVAGTGRRVLRTTVPDPFSATRKRRPEKAAGPVYVAPWSVRLLQIQLCFVYFFTGLGKVVARPEDQDWLSGEAVYWVLNDVAVARWPYHRLPVPMLLCQLASWATLVYEIGFPLFVVFRRLRPWVLAAGVALHLGILVSMEVGWFSPVTLCWYAVFLPAERIESAIRRRVSSERLVSP